MRERRHTLRKSRKQRGGFEGADDVCNQLAATDDVKEAKRIKREAMKQYRQDALAGAENRDIYDKIDACIVQFWPELNPVITIDGPQGDLKAKGKRIREEYRRRAAPPPQAPPPRPAAAPPPQAPPPRPAAPVFPIRVGVFSLRGPIVRGNLSGVQNGRFIVDGANVDPSMVQPSVKDVNFSKLSQWREWILKSARAGGSTRRRTSLPTRRGRRSSSSSKRRYTHRRPTLLTGKGGYLPTKSGRKA